MRLLIFYMHIRNVELCKKVTTINIEMLLINIIIILTKRKQIEYIGNNSFGSNSNYLK